MNDDKLRSPNKKRGRRVPPATVANSSADAPTTVVRPVPPPLGTRAAQLFQRVRAAMKHPETYGIHPISYRDQVYAVVHILVGTVVMVLGRILFCG